MSALEKLQNEVERQKRKISEIEKSIETVEKEFNVKFDAERNDIKKHKEFLEEPELEIAIVGTINAGKSTFINALLQRDIASTDARPETASLTKFKYSDKNKLEIKFYNREEWNDLWKSVEESTKKLQANVFKEEFESSGAKNIESQYIGKSDETIEVSNIEDLKNKIKDYTSKQSRIHYFVKELIVYLNKNIPENVTIVDTPGLNDVVAYRSNITSDYIGRANAVVVCQNHSNLGDKEFNDITRFFGNIGDRVDKVIILGTQIDKLNKPEKEWKNINVEWKKYFKVFYGEDDLLEKNIMGVSSFVYSNLIELEKTGKCDEKALSNIENFAKSYEVNLTPENSGSITASSPEELTKIFKEMSIKAVLKKSLQILDLTNIEKVNNLINKITKNYVEEIIGDLENRYSSMITDISNQANNIKNENSEGKASLDNDKQELEQKILIKNEEIKKIEEGMKELNETFEKIKEEWLNSNKIMKEKIRNRD